MKKKKNPFLFDEDEEKVYVGNIWGWKFSFISLALILGLAILMWVKQCQLDAAGASGIDSTESSARDSVGEVRGFPSGGIDSTESSSRDSVGTSKN